MAAIEDRKDVQWLFDRLNEATCEGELNTIVFIVKMEVSDENEYTKDAEVMERLRQSFADNRKRVKDAYQADSN